MNKTPLSESPNFDDEMLCEYQFDYRKAKPNRFAQQQSTHGFAKRGQRPIAFSGSEASSRSVTVREA